MSNNDDRSYAAKLISENPFVGLTHQTKEAKSRMLADFMYKYNALDSNGWNNEENSALASELQQSGYDLNQTAPLFSIDEQGNETDYVFDNKTGTIYEVGEDDQTGNIVLVPIESVEMHKFNLSQLFRNIGYGTGAISRRVTTPRPENFGE